MKYYQKPLVALTLLALGVQSYADVLQTSIGANHGTPKVVTQSENTITSRSLEINPYGKLSDVNQDQAEAIGIVFEQNPFVYGSGYHDTASALEYMGARYYSADIGRFMAQDSYDLINRYNYANANPIMYIDPDGHFAISDLLPHSKGGWVGMGAGIFVGVLAAALTGGASSLTLAGSVMAGIGEGAASGAVGNVVGESVDQGFSQINWVEMITSAGIGAGLPHINLALKIASRTLLFQPAICLMILMLIRLYSCVCLIALIRLIDTFLIIAIFSGALPFLMRLWSSP